MNRDRPQALRGREKALALSLLIALIELVSTGTAAADQTFLTTEAALSKLMPEAGMILTEHKTLTPELKERLEKMLGKRSREIGYEFHIGMKDERPCAYGIVLDMIGKERPITFMVVINPEGTIRAVEVLVYRESQGAEIRNPRFMRQFEGKTVQSPLRPGREIDTITGATLSSRSSAYVVKKALVLTDLFYGIGEGGPP